MPPTTSDNFMMTNYAMYALELSNIIYGTIIVLLMAQTSSLVAFILVVIARMINYIMYALKFSLPCRVINIVLPYIKFIHLKPPDYLTIFTLIY